MLFFSFQAIANQCRDFFSFATKHVNEFPINKIYAGQNSVGYEYAFFKALRDAGIDTSKDWRKLKGKEKAQIVKAILNELQSAVPVVIDPSGRVFAVDQHHDMFALLALIGPKAEPLVPIDILRDFSKENISMETFKDIVKRQGWIYERVLDEVVDKPTAIQDLVNSVERSVVGMAFIAISKSENISLKGKYFSPFVQFLLADYIQSQRLMQFGATYSREDVTRVIELINSDGSVRLFLRGHLIENHPKELRQFLRD